jgi:hypothetical protein
MQQFSNKWVPDPKKIFLVDSLGALLTAFLLFVILVTFNKYFGMPETTLHFLSITALVFSAYSFCCFLLLKNNWHPFLRAIIIANLLYCCLTLGLVIYHYQLLTMLGVIYFLAEIGVVCILVFIEIKVLATGNKINQQFTSNLK